MFQHLKEHSKETHGMRNGEPKRPESLIEMPIIVPEVPEVSLCFNQERNQLFQPNMASSFGITGIAYNTRQDQNEMLQRNKHESYNTWKAKNAQALHNLTGGLERTQPGSNQVSVTRKSAGLVRKQQSGEEVSPRSALHPRGTCEPAELNDQCSIPRHSPQMSCKSLGSTSGQPGNTYPPSQAEQQQAGQSADRHQITRCQARDSQQIEENFENPSSPSYNVQNHLSCKVRAVGNTSYAYQKSNKTNQNGNTGFFVPNYCDKFQCPCEKHNMYKNPLTEAQFVNENHGPTDELRAKLYSTIEPGCMNKHFSNLIQLTEVQKEQISMLFQEMNSQKMIMLGLLDEVKQIRAAVSPNPQMNREMPPTENKSCQCQTKNDENIRNKTSGDKIKNQKEFKENYNSTNTQPSSPRGVEKRSIGVMTSVLENSKVTCKEGNKPSELKNSVHKVKKHNQKTKPIHSLSPNKNKQTSKKENPKLEEKRKPQSNHTHRRKNKKEESNESSQSGDSFSLDEAAVVVRNETEQGEASPDVSIHVDMPDLSASSADSYTSDSSDSDDEGQESGTEGESSDPQIGWTFYDRVVGQVNNMLKKSPHDPRQEYSHPRRKNVGNVLYQYNDDYETENNWSKRVTFDGPPLDDSDNNGLHMPRYHHSRGNQDYRLSVGPERVQDFLVCDYANGANNVSLVNGSANMSFATYRYYQRHQLLPQPPMPEKVVHESHHNKKKSKSKKNEKPPPTSHKSHKRRSGGPPSKLLDISSLKHQPKLF